MSKKYLMLLLLFLLLSSLYIWSKSYCSQVSIKSFRSSSSSTTPRVLIIGSVHGNEPAGGEALKRLSPILKKGQLVIIPVMNKCGKALNMRYQPQNILQSNRDLNRNCIY